MLMIRKAKKEADMRKDMEEEEREKIGRKSKHN